MESKDRENLKHFKTTLGQLTVFVGYSVTPAVFAYYLWQKEIVGRWLVLVAIPVGFIYALYKIAKNFQKL